MIELFSISNPRTANGSWEDEKNGCESCGAITSAYFGIYHSDSDASIRLCLGCIDNGIEEVHRAILKQCEKRVE